MAQLTAPPSHYPATSPGSNKPNHFRRVFAKVNRNTTCPCGSGSKFKVCCKTEGELFNKLQRISMEQANEKGTAQKM